MYLPFVCGGSVLVFVLVWITLCLFLFASILTRKRQLIALLLLSFGCLVTINVLPLFLTVPCVGLHSVIVLFPDHTHLLCNENIISICVPYRHKMKNETNASYKPCLSICAWVTRALIQESFDRILKCYTWT